MRRPLPIMSVSAMAFTQCVTRTIQWWRRRVCIRVSPRYDGFDAGERRMTLRRRDGQSWPGAGLTLEATQAIRELDVGHVLWRETRLAASGRHRHRRPRIGVTESDQMQQLVRHH